jgi:hypothetical protein
MNPRIKKVQYKSPYKLILLFDNEELKEFDMSPYLSYPVFKVLKDESFCRKAKVFNGTVIWNDELDFDPDTLYLESKPLLASV